MISVKQQLTDTCRKSWEIENKCFQTSAHLNKCFKHLEEQIYGKRNFRQFTRYAHASSEGARDPPASNFITEQTIVPYHFKLSLHLSKHTACLIILLFESLIIFFYRHYQGTGLVRNIPRQKCGSHQRFELVRYLKNGF